jgi:hypothetical protein
MIAHSFARRLSRRQKLWKGKAGIQDARAQFDEYSAFFAPRFIKDTKVRQGRES